MRLLCVCVTVALAAAAGGCSKSADTVAKEARQAAASWGATLSAAAEWWGAGAVPTSYVQTVVTQARTALQKQEQTARQSAGDAAAAPLEIVASHAAAIEEAVNRGDRRAAIESGHAAASDVPAKNTPAVARPE